MLGYLGILTMAVCAGGAVLLFLFLSIGLGPKRPNPTKDKPYECGEEPFQISAQHLQIHFYQVAMLFIIFDVELAFLFPWAVNFKHLGWTGFMQITMFVFFILLGYLYVLKKKVLDEV